MHSKSHMLYLTAEASAVNTLAPDSGWPEGKGAGSGSSAHVGVVGPIGKLSGSLYVRLCLLLESKQQRKRYLILIPNLVPATVNMVCKPC